ncbi:MAG: PsbP-related protein [Methanobacterium sp.]
MQKFIYIIVLIIIAAIVSFFYLDSSNIVNTSISKDGNITTYNANGISFNYTKNWEPVNKTGKYVVVSLKDPTVNETDSKPGAVIEISKKASGDIPLEKYYDEVKLGASGVPGYQQVSENRLEVDNRTAYEFVANGMDNGIEEQFRIILFEKGGYIYMIACGTRAPTTLADKNDEFNVIINSFKAQ